MEQETSRPFAVVDYGRSRGSVWRRIIGCKAMRALAVILSGVGLWLLFVVADFRWGFVPMHVSEGPESGLIVMGLTFFAGIGVSAAAMFLAVVQLRRMAGLRLLLGWCCVLLLGFAAVLII